MRGLRPALIGLGIAGFAFALVSLALILTSDHFGVAQTETVFLAGHLLFIEVGLLTWWRRPDNRFGALMVAAGFTGLLANLTASNVPAVFTVGLFLGPLIAPVAAHMLLAYPTGRLERLERVIVGAMWAASVGLTVPALLFDVEPGAFTHGEAPPENLVLIGENSSFVSALVAVRGVVIGAGAVAIAAIFVRRWRAAGPLQRRALSPVLWTGGAAAVLYGALGGVEAVERDTTAAAALEWALLVYALVPVAFVVGLVRGRMFGAGAVGALMARLGDVPGPGELRDRLADALGDPSLMLAFWLPEESRYVDGEGRPVELPAPGSGRQWTPVERDGHPVAAIVHETGLTAADPETVRAAGGAAALALENERLEAELRARIAELAASRSRIIAAADEERRRLERDLHDGAQQRLVGLALKLRLARSRLENDAGAGAVLLDESLADLEAALAELRELARGIHPAVLTERGLQPALATLASRVPVPVELDADTGERLPADVEAAAYFVAAEALTNVAKYAEASHATVRVARVNGWAVVEVADDGVGGADPGDGSGLRGLRDRVAALDGTLQVESPLGGGTLIRAEIPCGS
jgi:signal transduction histidine kinase